MTFYRTFLTGLFLLIYGVWSATAQGECLFNVEEVLENVTEQCADIEANEVCYGNRDITANPRIRTIDFIFDNPGDRAELSNIRSLLVNPAEISADTWGVAQMRLQIGSPEGVQDVIFFLFGQFYIDNAVETTPTIDLQVRSFEINIRSLPIAGGDVLETLPAGSLLTGVARTENSTWLRVEDPDTRVVGWVENAGLDLLNEADSIGVLPVQDPNVPYFGAMQAFYFENGNTDLGCDSVASDGLIVQTPDGEARISLLVNEVSIELTGAPAQTEEDEDVAASAFIQADPETETGMSVNVLGGEAAVTSAGTTETVATGQQSSIPITVDLQAVGAPSAPQDAGDVSVNIRPFIPAVQFPSTNNASGDGSNTSGSVTGIGAVASGSGGGNSGSTSGDGGSGVGGVDIATTTGTGGNGSGSGSTSSGGSSGGVQVDTSNPFENTNPDLPSSVDELTGVNRPPQTEQRPENENFFTQGNILALALAISSGLAVMLFLLWYTRRRSKLGD